MLSQVLLLVLFLLTAAAVTARPLRVSPGWWPVVAVVVATSAGVVSLGTVARGINSSLDVLAFFAGLLLLAWSLSRVGLLARSLDGLERWAGAEPRRLLLAVAFATVLVTALLSNDAAALLLAPEVLDRIRRRELALAPFVLTMAFAANAGSALLPISNPVNLLILDRSHLALAAYLGGVTPGAVLGVAITVAGCLCLAGQGLSRSGQAPPADPSPRMEPAAWRVAGVVALLIVCDLGFAVARLPIGPPTLIAGVLTGVLVGSGRGGWKLPRGVGWSILPLVAGFSVLATGVERSNWLAGAASHAVGGGSGLLAGVFAGLGTGLLAGVINNLPAALLVTAGLQAAHHLGSLVMPAIVGADLGPNLAPFGSLSTVLILGAVRARGEPVPWRRVWSLGLLLGPIALVPTVLVVALAR
ncbi:MAG TPA: SLC13 family permease [Candidatus Dormibacteraeota bacterium]